MSRQLTVAMGAPAEARIAGGPSPRIQGPPSEAPVATVVTRGNVFILAMYSGYIVSGPPSLAS
jgi:hypothetical protein